MRAFWMVMILITGCGKMESIPKLLAQAPASLPPGGVESPAGPPAAPDKLKLDPPAGSNLYLQVDSFWENAPADITQQLPAARCAIPDGSANQVIRCQIYIPEDMLYYSRLIFSVGSLSRKKDACDTILFKPYYYMADDRNPNFSAFWGGADCSKSMPNCWGGVAPELVPNFPSHRYFYVVLGDEPADLPVQRDYTMPRSTHEIALVGSLENQYFAEGENNLTCNTKTDRTAPFSIGIDSYVGGNQWQDYVLSCFDAWGQELHRIELTISDDPAQSGFPSPPGYVPGIHRSRWN